jgi:hypothetical protein
MLLEFKKYSERDGISFEFGKLGRIAYPGFVIYTYFSKYYREGENNYNWFFSTAVEIIIEGEVIKSEFEMLIQEKERYIITIEL